jgi:thiol-disulfide isomerase/thioredoxin
MNRPNSMKLIVFTYAFLFMQLGFAQENSAVKLQSFELKRFELGSFEKIVSAKSTQDHLVILWSFDCPPCITELEKISALHLQYPEYQLTLINTDAVDEQVRVVNILQRYDLLKHDNLASWDSLENWGFADVDEEKLRYDIDPRWFGDLPRAYFLPLQGKVKRLRGALTSAELLELFQPR